VIPSLSQESTIRFACPRLNFPSDAHRSHSPFLSDSICFTAPGSLESRGGPTSSPITGVPLGRSLHFDWHATPKALLMQCAWREAPAFRHFEFSVWEEAQQIPGSCSPESTSSTRFPLMQLCCVTRPARSSRTDPIRTARRNFPEAQRVQGAVCIPFRHERNKAPFVGRIERIKPKNFAGSTHYIARRQDFGRIGCRTGGATLVELNQ